jgi:hypothetical protein
VAVAAAAFVLLAGTRFLVVPTADGAWRGVSPPPTLARGGLAIAVGVAVAVALRRRAPGLRKTFLALGLAAAPLVPVLGGRVPALLSIQGPVLFLVAVGVAAVAIVVAAGPRLAARRPPREAILFAAALAGYTLLGAFLPGPAGPQGDEPHYLLMAHSLWSDGDLDLADDHARAEYAGFYADTLAPHYSANARGGRYSKHMPGLAFVLLPGYALAGADGARFGLAALAALSGALVYRLARASLRSPAAALGAWAAYSLAPPVAFYAVSVYPETAALAPVAILLLTSRGEATAKAVAAAAAAASVLPWLHTKFLPVAAVGLGLALLRPGRRRAKVAGAIVFAVSTLLLLAFLRAYYGSASLTAAFGPAALSVAQVPFGALGLFLDRQFGLFLASPVWLLALPGAALVSRWRPGDALRALLVAASVVVVAAPYAEWWGGSCPPGRYLLPALPALALALAAGVRSRPVAAAALGGASLAITVLGASAPRLTHARPDGDSALLRYLSPAVDLAPSLPSFVSREGPQAWQAPVLGASLLGSTALAFAGGAPGVAAGLLGYAAVAGGLRTDPWIDAGRAGALVLAEWEPDRWRGTRPLDPRRLRLPLELPRAPWTVAPGERRRSRRLDVPPGAYRLDVRSEGDGQARLVIEAGELPLAVTALRGSTSSALVLPMGARRLGIAVTGEREGSIVHGATLVPEEVVARHARDGLRWPRWPRPERYRVGATVRATPIGRAEVEGDGFRLPGEGEDFVVDGPAGAWVRLRVERAQPRPDDAVRAAGRRRRLGPARTSVLELSLDDGPRLGEARALAVRVEAPGAWVAFEAK